jgi:hypothetical protein
VQLDDLAEIMTTAHIDPACYGIERDVPGGLCIRAAGRRWDVYVSGEGTRSEERAFSSENDACVYFLLRALELYVRPGRAEDLDRSQHDG